jgi:hypothetical protein
MDCDSKGILVFNLKYEHAISYLFFKLPVSRFLAINIEGKIGQLTVRRTSSFNMRQATCLKDEILKFQ